MRADLRDIVSENNERPTCCCVNDISLNEHSSRYDEACSLHWQGHHIAHAVEPDRRGRGYAKEAAAALVSVARDAGVRIVLAHTRPADGPSTRVLQACGFTRVGAFVDPEDGLVWRWEREAS